MSGGGGSVDGTAVDTVSVVCTTIQYTVGGEVQGLTEGESVTLTNNGADALKVDADGPFTFDTAIDDGTDYSVEVSVQPEDPDNQCTVLRGQGGLVGADVTDILVRCGYEFPWPMFLPAIINRGTAATP